MRSSPWGLKGLSLSLTFDEMSNGKERCQMSEMRGNKRKENKKAKKEREEGWEGA